MINQANYYGMMPAKVRYNNNLSSGAKVLFSEFTALSGDSGCCVFSKKELAKEFAVTPLTISNWVKNLASEGCIEIVENKNKNTNETTVRLRVR